MIYVLDAIIIILLFSFFSASHTYLASNNFKRKLVQRYGSSIAFYRILYNLFALVTFYLFYIISPHPDLTIYDLPYPYDFIILGVQFISLAGIFLTIRYFSLKEFIGLNQIIKYYKNEYNTDELDEKLTLRIEGPYKYMRHPLYFFSIIFLTFRPTMDFFYLILLICLIAYFVVGSYYEEKKMVERFGEVYVKYRDKVPRIFPFKLFTPYMSASKAGKST